MNGGQMLSACRVERNQLQAFMEFPFSLYSPAEAWCPRPVADISSWFSGKHPLCPHIDFTPFIV